jgi:hypothetical protein
MLSDRIHGGGGGVIGPKACGVGSLHSHGYASIKAVAKSLAKIALSGKTKNGPII